MAFLWHDQEGRAIFAAEADRRIPQAAGRITIPRSKLAAIAQRLDVYRVEGFELFCGDELVDLTPDAPVSVTPLQARRALRAAELLPAFAVALAAADDETREAWEYATEIRRDNPLVADFADELGLTEEQVDDLFRLAATL